MNRDAKMTLLLDLYGKLLSKSQFDSMDLYYNKDFSLSEIASHMNKSRQGVRDSIKRGELILENAESSLELIRKFSTLRNYLNLIKELAVKAKSESDLSSGSSNINIYIDRIIEIINKFNF